MDGAIRYWAFLSYSHDDRRAAERLHRVLESYRIPRRLTGRQGPFGIVPPRLHPIFRDRDELTASGHLGVVVEAALAASRNLIVLCSPASADSPWVESEIAAFHRLHPEAPVLCVLLAGEPLGRGAAGSANNSGADARYSGVPPEVFPGGDTASALVRCGANIAVPLP